MLGLESCCQILRCNKDAEEYYLIRIRGLKVKIELCSHHAKALEKAFKNDFLEKFSVDYGRYKAI